MTASEHTTGSDSLEHRMHPPKSGTTTARQRPVRNPLRDFPGIPRLTYSTRKRPSAAENSPIRNKLLGRQLTGENQSLAATMCGGECTTRRMRSGSTSVRIADDPPKALSRQGKLDGVSHLRSPGARSKPGQYPALQVVPSTCSSRAWSRS